MPRLTLIARTLAAAGALAFMATLGAQQPPAPQPDPANLEVQKVNDNVYVVKGGGGNTTVSLTSRGAVVTDFKNPGWGSALLYARFNRLFLDDVRAALAQGKTPDEIAAAWKVPNGYTGYTAAPARVKENAQKVAEETKR
jgi:hypothetical protein